MRETTGKWEKIKEMYLSCSPESERLAMALVKLFGYTKHVDTIDIEYNERLDHQQPCLEDELNGGSNNIVQSNKSVWRQW